MFNGVMFGSNDVDLCIVFTMKFDGMKCSVIGFEEELWTNKVDIFASSFCSNTTSDLVDVCLSIFLYCIISMNFA
jgi:hypothetical protein